MIGYQVNDQSELLAGVEKLPALPASSSSKTFFSGLLGGIVLMRMATQQVVFCRGLFLRIGNRMIYQYLVLC